MVQLLKDIDLKWYAVSWKLRNPVPVKHLASTSQTFDMHVESFL